MNGLGRNELTPVKYISRKKFNRLDLVHLFRGTYLRPPLVVMEVPCHLVRVENIRKEKLTMA